MKRNFDQQQHFDGSPDKRQKLDSGQGAGQSSRFDLSRHLLGGDGRRNTRIPQNRLFKDYISYTDGGPDVPPQHSEETLSMSFRHDAPGQESPMSAPGPLEMTRDGKLLLQADEHYAKGEYEEAERSLRCVLDNCAKDPERNGLKINLALHGLAKIYKKQERYGNAEELYKFLIEYNSQEHQQDDLKIGAALKGIGDVYKKQGKDKEAKALFKSIIDVCKKKFGEDDPKTALVMKKLAKVYEMQEKPAKAGALLHEYVLPIFKDKLGENDPRTEKVQKNLTDLPVKPEQEMTRGTRKPIAERRVNFLLDYIKYHKRFPDLCEPKVFNDKALHRALFDRRPILTLFQDKYAIREFVKETIGEEYLPKLLCEPTKDPSAIPFKDLPNQFVIKCNQGARADRVIVVTDKSTINESEIIEQCKAWVDPKNNPYYETGTWGLKNVDPCIMVEEYINDGKGKAPYDYKFFNYKGVIEHVQVEAGRFEDYSSTFYDTNWKQLQMTHGEGKNCATPLPRPWHLEEMRELTQKLNKGLQELAQKQGKGPEESLGFVRVDYFDTERKVIFAEITAVPGKSMARFEPLMYDRIFGEPWKEVYNKSSIKSLPPSSDVCQMLRQITCGMHKLILERQRNRQDSQEKGLVIKSGE